MKRILILVAMSFFLCSAASALQGGGGEPTKKASSKKKAVTKKKDSGIKSANVTPPRRATLAMPTRTPSLQVFGPGLSIDLGNNVKLELVQIKAGTFQMGSEKYDSEKPVHRVTISEPFYLAKFEMTQAQWQAVMGNNPSYFKNCGGNCPVENVSWEDAQKFIERLNTRGDGYIYRLPTEAEWEYSARAGTNGLFAFGESLSSTQANFDANFPNGGYASRPYLQKKMKPVGSYQPNAWGLYDMHGNVDEWCQDRYGSYSDAAVTDPKGASNGEYRVLRGGSLLNAAEGVRSSGRGFNTPGERFDSVGFRVVAVVRTDSQVSTAPNPTMNSTDIQSDSSGKKRLYRFSSDGCVVVEVHVGHVDFYPKGGEIIITPPSPAEAFRDKPGIVQPQRNFPIGTYKICATDRNAWGVEVRN